MTPENGETSNAKKFPQAREKIASVTAKVGRPLIVFVNPAALPAPEKREEERESEREEERESEREAGEESLKAAAQEEEAGVPTTAFKRSKISRDNRKPSSIPSFNGEGSDSFYDFTPEDFARLAATKKEDKYLRTRQIREREEEAARSRITKAVIRVQFPDGWIVESNFQPSDPISAVREFISRCLKLPDRPFYFYTTPPKQRLKDEALSLYAARLAPGAIIHFSYEGEAVKGLTDPLISTAFLCDDVAELRDLHLEAADMDNVTSEEEGPPEEEAAPPPKSEPPKAATGKGKGVPRWFKR